MLLCKDCGRIFDESELVEIGHNTVPYGDMYVRESTDYGCPDCHSDNVVEYFGDDEIVGESDDEDDIEGVGEDSDAEVDFNPFEGRDIDEDCELCPKSNNAQYNKRTCPFNCQYK